MNIVADTNVIVAALRSRKGASHKFVQMVRRGDMLRLHLSAAVVLEYEEVLLRELVPDFFSPEEIGAFLDDLILVSVRHARIVARRPLSSDPDDDSLLELAFTADVDCVVTFNKAHLRPAEDMGIDLLTPSELLQQLRQ
jgi:putative PIN family toxin of toxin-antitoxin system